MHCTSMKIEVRTPNEDWGCALYKGAHYTPKNTVGSHTVIVMVLEGSMCCTVWTTLACGTSEVRNMWNDIAIDSMHSTCSKST